MQSQGRIINPWYHPDYRFVTYGHSAGSNKPLAMITVPAVATYFSVQSLCSGMRLDFIPMYRLAPDADSLKQTNIKNNSINAFNMIKYYIIKPLICQEFSVLFSHYFVFLATAFDQAE